MNPEVSAGKRGEALHREMDEIRPLLDAFFAKRQAARNDMQVGSRESSEFIHFEHVSL